MIFLTFIIGMLVNFSGYLPPGNINLTVVKIAINRGFRQALYFIIPFSCVEFFFTLFIIHAAEWLSNQLNLSTIIDWVMLVLFTVLGTVTWINRGKKPHPNYSNYDSIKYGIILGIVNPVQIPFWIISGTYLITHHWIVTGTVPLILFSLGSATGAFGSLFLFARFATYVQTRFELSTKTINSVIALLFFCFAAYHMLKQLLLLWPH